MTLSRENLERQLSQAQARLENRVEALKAKGVEAKAYRKDPKWRNLNADCASLKSRIRAVGVIEAREQAAETRKQEKAAAGE